VSPGVYSWVHSVFLCGCTFLERGGRARPGRPIREGTPRRFQRRFPAFLAMTGSELTLLGDLSGLFTSGTEILSFAIFTFTGLVAGKAADPDRPIPGTRLRLPNARKARSKNAPFARPCVARRHRLRGDYQSPAGGPLLLTLRDASAPARRRMSSPPGAGTSAQSRPRGR